MIGWRHVVLVLLCAAAPAACGGGGGASPAAVPAGPGSTVPTPGPARAYTGTRTITVTGSPGPAIPQGSYTIAELDQDVTPPAGAPSGAAVDRHAVRTYTGALPTAGIALQTETRDDELAAVGAGIAVLATNDVVVGRDIGAEQSSPGGVPVIDTRTTATAYAPNAVVIPPPAGAASVAFPLAATVHLTEKSLAANGAIARSTDYTRVTAADGSFDETGFFSDVAVHGMHQRADGTATSHDQLPGFSLRDVAIGAPAGAALAVTLQTQGRTIGNPPIVTTSYSTPVWYAPGAIASATLYENANVAPPPDCAVPASQPALRLNLARSHVDVAAGVRFVENDENYVDASGQTLCRVTTEANSYFDITTGAVIGLVDDRTMVRFTGLISQATFASSRRR